MLPSLKVAQITVILMILFKSYDGEADFLANGNEAVRTLIGNLQETTEAVIMNYWESLKPALVL